MLYDVPYRLNDSHRKAPQEVWFIFDKLSSYIFYYLLQEDKWASGMSASFGSIFMRSVTCYNDKRGTSLYIGLRYILFLTVCIVSLCKFRSGSYQRRPVGGCDDSKIRQNNSSDKRKSITIWSSIICDMENKEMCLFCHYNKKDISQTNSNLIHLHFLQFVMEPM
jgi:hypothetical protein